MDICQRRELLGVRVIKIQKTHQEWGITETSYWAPNYWARIAVAARNNLFV